MREEKRKKRKRAGRETSKVNHKQKWKESREQKEKGRELKERPVK